MGGICASLKGNVSSLLLFGEKWRRCSLGAQGEVQEAQQVLYPTPKPKWEEPGNYSDGDEFFAALPHYCPDIVQLLLLPFMRLLVLPGGFINADSFSHAQ